MALGFDTRGSHCPGFLAAVAATMIRFPKVLIAYWRAFAVGFLVGWFVNWDSPSQMESMYERIKARVEHRYPETTGIDASHYAIPSPRTVYVTGSNGE